MLYTATMWTTPLLAAVMCKTQNRAEPAFDDGIHLAPTANVFTTPRHGSPKTRFETLTEQLFLPKQACIKENHQIGSLFEMQ